MRSMRDGRNALICLLVLLCVFAMPPVGWATDANAPEEEVDLEGDVETYFLQQRNTDNVLVITQGARMMSDLKKGARSLGTYNEGVRGTYVLYEDGFVKVRVGNTQGYFDLNDVTMDVSGLSVTEDVPSMQVSPPKGYAYAFMRQRPQSDSKSMGQIARGTHVYVLASVGEWSHVLIGEKDYGYIFTKYLTPAPRPTTTPEPTPGPTATPDPEAAYKDSLQTYMQGLLGAQVATIATEGARLRAQADDNAPLVGVYHQGVTAAYLPDSNDTWMHIQIGEADGYMRRADLTADVSQEAMGENIPLMVVNDPNDRLPVLRQGPSDSSHTLAQFQDGSIVLVLGEIGEWAHALAGGQVGYILKEDLRAHQAAE